MMFNAMLTHGFNQEDLLLSTIISIPKDNPGSMKSRDNSRDISLNFDYSKTDDMQFGFKNNHSTVLGTAVYIATVNHYMNESSMFIAVLLTRARL